jgi:microcystin-dependent protein
MPVPLPIDIVMGALPQGFKGNLQEYANAIADAMSATVEASFLTGQIGGAMPTSDIGPWANGNEWWFWDPATGQYQPTDQGTPVGAVILWGGAGVPINWLLCDGRPVSRVTFSRLYQAVGDTWGAGDGVSTFALPPGGKFFVNAPGFVADSAVPIDAGYGPQGVGTGRGGAQTFKISGSNLPQLMTQVWGYPAQVGSGGNTIYTPGGPTDKPINLWKVLDAYGGNVGANDPVPFLPPFAAINYIIKYQ